MSHSGRDETHARATSSPATTQSSFKTQLDSTLAAGPGKMTEASSARMQERESFASQQAGRGGISRAFHNLKAKMTPTFLGGMKKQDRQDANTTAETLRKANTQLKSHTPEASGLEKSAKRTQMAATVAAKASSVPLPGAPTVAHAVSAGAHKRAQHQFDEASSAFQSQAQSGDLPTLVGYQAVAKADSLSATARGENVAAKAEAARAVTSLAPSAVSKPVGMAISATEKYAMRDITQAQTAARAEQSVVGQRAVQRTTTAPAAPKPDLMGELQQKLKARKS